MAKKRDDDQDEEEAGESTETASTRAFKEMGQVFTPPEIADYLVQRPILAVLKENQEPSIVDPACGDGALLLASFDVLCWKKQAKTASERSAVSRLIHGVELDEDLAQECRDNLAEAGADQATIVTADSLTLDYASAFPETGGRFDIVVSNPPYVRHELQDKASMDLLKFSYETYRKNSDLYVFFVELGFKIAKEGGKLAYLIPNKFLRAAYGKELRIFLKKKRLEYLVDLNDISIFSGFTVYPLLLFATNAPSKDADMMLVANVHRDDLPQAPALVAAYLMSLDASEVMANRAAEVAASSIDASKAAVTATSVDAGLETSAAPPRST